ncbi:MAG: LysR substrate-binding domain-containing protein [Chloroflexota bacterium]
MNLEQLRSFRAVAEQGSFSRAADARFLAQPTVSMQVAALERELGVRLFDRLGWRVVLSDAGAEFLQYAVRILSLVEESRRAMAEIQGIAAGQLIVGASQTIGNYIVPRHFGTFNARYPGVRLVLEILPIPAIAERIREGSLDLGMIEAPIVASDLLTRPFLTDELVLIVPQGHPWSERGVVEAEDLARERFIARDPESLSGRIVRERLSALGIEVVPTLQVGTPEAVRESVRAGLGVGIVSRHVVTLALAAGVVAEVPVRGLRVERNLRVVLHKQKHVSRALAAFLQILGLDPEDLAAST